MVQTTLIPNNNTVQIAIPENYIGKKVHALIYIDDEILQTPVNSSDYSESKEEPILLEKKVNKFIEISPLVKSLTGVVPNLD